MYWSGTMHGRPAPLSGAIRHLREILARIGERLGTCRLAIRADTPEDILLKCTAGPPDDLRVEIARTKRVVEPRVETRHATGDYAEPEVTETTGAGGGRPTDYKSGPVANRPSLFSAHLPVTT